MRESLITHQLSAIGGEWEIPPWPLAVELSQVLPEDSWTLVGGLMVSLRAALHSIQPNRITSDVDATVTIHNNSSVRYSRLAALLVQAGFSPHPTKNHSYRFVRNTEKSPDIVDLMHPDGVHPNAIPKLKGLPVFSIPGGHRAVKNREQVFLQLVDDRTVTLNIPSLRDSLALKGAAYHADSRDRNRHLSDGIILLACVDNPKDIRVGLSQRSRKRIRALLRGLDNEREPWLDANEVARDQAKLVLQQMRDLFDINGTITPERLERFPE